MRANTTFLEPVINAHIAKLDVIPYAKAIRLVLPNSRRYLTFSPRLKQGDSCIDHHCTATEVVASYTMSDRRYFPCVPRYGMYLSSRLLLKPFMQNINGSVFIAVVNRVTRRTFPLTDAEVLDSHILIAAATACLAARIECRYTNYCTTVPIGFVLQHAKERRPRNTGNSSCKLMVMKHSFYIKVFDADGLIFTHQHSRLFLKEIVSLISNLFVGGSDSYTLLFTIM